MYKRQMHITFTFKTQIQKWRESEVSLSPVSYTHLTLPTKA
ncbi:hypothetical protein JMUB7542_28020 [Staphylococcus aureus]